MPNIVQLWDFEDGTTQGWSLGSYTSLDANSKVQGTYSIKYQGPSNHAEEVNRVVMSISGIDLSSVSKPVLIFIIKDESQGDYPNNPAEVGVVVKDNAGNTLLDVTVYLVNASKGWVRVVVVDLSTVAGQSNLTIEIRERGHTYNPNTRIHYYDQIAILDGADYEYDTGVVVSDDEDKTVDVEVPSTDQDVSSLNATKLALALATPDWNYSLIETTVETDQGTLTIGSGSAKNVNYLEPTNPFATFSKLTVHMRVSIGSYAGWTEKVAVVFLDTSWSYKRIYLFNIYFTANGVSPRFISAVSTTTYGSTASGYRDINAKIHGNSFDIALKVKIIYGDKSVINSGSVKLEVYSSDLSTKYGEVTIDLTVANEQVSSYVTGMPCDVDLVLRVSWSINANARVVVLAYPLVKIY